MAEPVTVWESLKQIDTWSVGAISFALGALGGLAHALGGPEPAGSQDATVVASPSVPLAQRPKVDWLRQMVVGAVAAAAALFVMHPVDGLALVSSSLVVGYAGRAVLVALGDKTRIALAEQTTRAVAKERDEAKHDVLRLADAVQSKASGDRSQLQANPLDALASELRRRHENRAS